MTLHFDGPAIAGGIAYPPGDVLAAPAPRAHPTGIGWLDELTGGITPGEVWAILGAAGLGVSRLATLIAVAASATADVLLANGHIGTRRLAGVVAQAAGQRGADDESLPRLASWLPTPALGSDAWDGACEQADIVVMDTWDEMWRPPDWSRTGEQRLADARWLRECARAHSTAAVLTARLPAWAHSGSDEGEHASRDALTDVADMLLRLHVDDDGRRVLVAHVRGGRSRETAMPAGTF